MRKRSSLFVLALLAGSPVAASDGVHEINQTCAVQTGCFPGDTPAGFPVLITGPGSYRLTSNLIVPNENTDGIVVQASDVGIDLNGFAILRLGCEATTVNCTPTSGTGAGIRRTAASRRAISVRNGSIVGMGEWGVVLGNQGEASNLRVRWNRVGGIFADIGSTISDCQAFQNAGTGIDTTPGKATISGSRADGNGGVGFLAGDDANISNSSAYQNGTFGIKAGQASRVSGSTANFNLGDPFFDHAGIDVGQGSVVSNSTASFNTSAGIIAGPGSTVSYSTAAGNSWDGIDVSFGSTVSGSTTYENLDDGIETSAGSLVYGSTARDNTNVGLRLGDDSAYRENSITSNANGTVQLNGFAGTVVNLGANFCTDALNATVACP